MSQTYDSRRWLSLSIIIMAMFMVVLDVFIVNVALPSIQQMLHADFTKLQFIVAGYVLSYAVLLITGGRLGDLFGRKKMFLLGVAGFVLTSAWCGFSTSSEMLITARVFQGISAAAMVPQVLSLIQVLFPVEERGKALGIYGAVLGIGGVAGQVVGGLLLEADWWGMGWRLVFLVNIPVGIVAFLLAFWLIRESYATERKRLDLTGVGLVTLGLILLIYPLVVGRERGWPMLVYFSIALSAVVLTGFVLFEKMLQRQGASPLVPITLFQDVAFRRGMLIALAFYSGNAALYFILSVFMQSGLGFAPLQSAYTFIPLGAGYFIASLLTPNMKKRFGNRVLLAGAIFMAIGYLLLIGIIEGSTTFAWTAFFIPLLIAGAGQGAIASPLIHTVLAGVKGAHAGAASGVLNTFSQVAQAVGVAVIGSLFQSMLSYFGAGSRVQVYIETLQSSLVLITVLAVVTFLLVMTLGYVRKAERRLSVQGDAS
ncbi:MFS transporter [Paenibacillus sp. GCM10027628]|uniref:MFS transporter n=1 Tax=Paenibacillus sp. GCM10027628 TaxID=3273413 RepID=UPI0036319BAE